MKNTHSDFSRFFLFLILMFSHPFPTDAADPTSAIPWQPFSDQIFEQAAKEQKLILIDLEAIWCHWCHVMDKETYFKPEIQNLINKHFIPVRVDQDSRPDLSTRYQNYGWPATIILSADGTDLRKRAGYIQYTEMKELLTDAVAHPTPEEDSDAPAATPSVATATTLSEELKAKLNQKHENFFDIEKGGLDFSQRFLNADSIELTIREASEGAEAKDAFARTTLTASLKLVDPVWGGVYQYSTDRDWDHPHYEKIVPSQAIAIKSYSYGYAQFQDEAYRNAAMSIRNYIREFLHSPQGSFYTSQDADLVKGKHSSDYFALNNEERRKRGIPAIDIHSYAYENGLLIAAFTSLHSATGDKDVLEDARAAARWMLGNRSLNSGGFSHDEKDTQGAYLRDNVAMGYALLTLHGATGERSFLERSMKSGEFIGAHFLEKDLDGFWSFIPSGIIKPLRLQEENIAAVRYLNLLSQYSGDEKFHLLAGQGLKWLARPEVALQSSVEPGILLADKEFNSAPLHVTIVGHKDDPAAAELFKAALRYPNTYKRTDWWDKREGALINPDVEYPELETAAAFICTEKRCSLPIFTPEKIAKVISTGAKKK